MTRVRHRDGTGAERNTTPMATCPSRWNRSKFDDERLHTSEGSPSHLKPVITLGYFSGMRKGEILSIEWSQVDFLHRTIRLHPGETPERPGCSRSIPTRRLVEFWRVWRMGQQPNSRKALAYVNLVIKIAWSFASQTYRAPRPWAWSADDRLVFDQTPGDISVPTVDGDRTLPRSSARPTARLRCCWLTRDGTGEYRRRRKKTATEGGCRSQRFSR